MTATTLCCGFAFQMAPEYPFRSTIMSQRRHEVFPRVLYCEKAAQWVRFRRGLVHHPDAGDQHVRVASGRVGAVAKGVGESRGGDPKCGEGGVEIFVLLW